MANKEALNFMVYACVGRVPDSGPHRIVRAAGCGIWRGGRFTSRRMVGSACLCKRGCLFRRTTWPQLPFRPERLFVQSDIAGNFEIIDIIIGNRSQFAQATPMSARIAAETSFGL